MVVNIDIANIILALVVLVGAVQSILNARAIKRARDAIDEVHKATNSMHDEIVALTKLDAIAEERARVAAAVIATEKNG